ncbi:MAG TPA: hypothetical protein VF631_14920 [Allosphingosinicella sp.]|jgi:hypothetical protein|uniref:hypothetical protein n=1 Tax=Allosphingosinicella sp. TaxID=2823234 RepID=UPI002F28D628
MISGNKPALALAIAAAVLGTAASAQMQEAAVPSTAASAASECELHVWPAERFNAMTTGWLSGFGVVGAVADAAGNADKNKDNRTQIAAALDSQGQVDALTSMNLVELLKAKPSRIVVHSEALDRKTINKIDTRRAQSTSPCYAELIVADVFYHKAAIYGRSLKTLFMYRNFGTSEKKPAIYKAWGGNGLKLFPPKDGEDVQAANSELVSVFKANFEEFAKNARGNAATSGKTAAR